MIDFRRHGKVRAARSGLPLQLAGAIAALLVSVWPASATTGMQPASQSQPAIGAQPAFQSQPPIRAGEPLQPAGGTDAKAADAGHAPGTGNAAKTGDSGEAVEPPPLAAWPLSPAVLEIESLGDEPRTLLRAPLGTGERLTLEFNVEGLTTVAGERLPLSMVRPITVHWVLELTVGTRDEEGRVRLDGVVRTAEVVPHTSNPQSQIEETEAAVRPLRGRRIELELGREGGLTALRLPVGPSIDAGPSRPEHLFAEALATILRPQPIEPVGRGARWTVRMEQRLREVDRTATIICDVQSIDGDVTRVNASIAVRASASRAMVSDGRVPEGRLAVVANLEGSGAATTTWSREKFLPTTLREQRLVSTIFESLVPDETGRAGGEKRTFFEERDMLSLRVGLRPLVAPQPSGDSKPTPEAETREPAAGGELEGLGRLGAFWRDHPWVGGGTDCGQGCRSSICRCVLGLRTFWWVEGSQADSADGRARPDFSGPGGDAARKLRRCCGVRVAAHPRSRIWPSPLAPATGAVAGPTWPRPGRLPTPKSEAADPSPSGVSWAAISGNVACGADARTRSCQVES